VKRLKNEGKYMKINRRIKRKHKTWIMMYPKAMNNKNYENHFVQSKTLDEKYKKL